MLTASPLAYDASRWKDLCQEAQGYHQSIGGHVILADLEMRMLFNTRDADGTVVELHGTVPDITERKRAEEDRCLRS